MATASDDELLQLAQAATVNGQAPANAIPTPAGATPAVPTPGMPAPVIGTPEGPGIPPIAPVPPDAGPAFQPDVVTTGNAPTPGAPVVQTPEPLHIKGIDTRAADLARASQSDVAQAEANKAPLIADKAESGAQELEKNAAAGRDAAVEIQAEAQAQKDGIAQARQIADSAQDEVKDFKFHDYYGDKSTAGKVIANIQYALGAFAAGGSSGNGVNQAAEKIKMINAQQFEKDKARLSSLQNIASYKERGVTDLQSQYRDDLTKLQLKQALGLKAAADEAKAFLLRTNVPLEQAENNSLVQKLRAEGDKDYSATIEKLQHDKAMESLERAKLAQQREQNQPEDPQKLAILAQLAQQPGIDQATLYKAAAQLGIKDVNKSLLPIQKNPDKEAADAERKKAALDSRTVFFDGVPSKLASSPRQVKSIEDRDIQYADAIKSLQDLRKSGNFLPIGNDAYDRAVIALNTVTTANSSDKTTAHEANTIKKFGLISNDAIDKTLEHITNRREEFRKNLQDIPGEQSGKSGESAPAKETAMPSASKIRSLAPADRNDAIEATQALGGPDDAAARKLLRHLGVM